MSPPDSKQVVNARLGSSGDSDLRLLEAAFADSTIGMGLIEVSPDGGERLVKVNRALCEITGIPEENLVDGGSELLTLKGWSRETESRRVTGIDRGRVEFEHTLERPDGTTVWALITLSPLRKKKDEEGSYRLAQVQDISDRRDYEAQLHYLAEHDFLTGLANLKKFLTAVDEWLAYRKRFGGTCALISFDLDRFKLVNDTAGHAAGDEALKGFAGFLQKAVRETDTVARLGGDEFAVFLPGTDGKGAMELAEALRSQLRSNPIEIYPEGIGPLTLSTSAGVTELGGRDDVAGRDLLVEADAALYAAKRAGRNCVVDYRFGTDPKVVDMARLTWAERTRRALDRGTFFLDAQPIVSLATGELVGYEALLRMNDPDEGVVYPPTFLYTAERFGLAAEIDEWVLRTVIDCLSRAPDTATRVGLNLSSASLDLASGLPDLVSELLADSGVDPRRIGFELTEGTCILDIERARGFIEGMRQVGVSVALDDFGAGFGSFHYLKVLPVDLLKLDGEFVRSLTTSTTDQVIVDAVVKMSHGLGLQVVAEFVADRATAEACEKLDVDQIQGSYAGPTLPLAQALGLE